jgi:hypothetical protein
MGALEMNDDNMTRKIVEPILRRALEPMGLADLELSSSEDHYGDPIIRGIARYRPDAPKFQARVYLDAVVEAMAALSRNGDDRFILVQNLFSDGEPAIDDYLPPPKRRRAKAIAKG